MFFKNEFPFLFKEQICEYLFTSIVKAESFITHTKKTAQVPKKSHKAMTNTKENNNTI